MYPSTSAELARNSQEPAHRKWTPTAMTSQQPEPLKVFLQHRIKSIISKEWWDFVVNVNNMNSDHASLLYSVANLCPSFQNFLRTRDKELNYILKKRPQIKPRIFSGSERSDIPTAPAVPTEVPSSHRKSCSAELDQILNELYPDERSIIKRKPRTFGPISKQKRLQNLKKFQLLQSQKEIPTDEPTTPTLSKILREDKPCTTVKRPENLPPSTSNRDSKHSVEYTISNYDVNRNKLSLNMKKVKKIIKVKKKIMTYTDNNDKSRTKYLLESETPDLKRELIKKYRIKKCSVALQRLTWKQIKEIKAKGKVAQSQMSSVNVIKTVGNNLVTNIDTVPPISLKLCLGKAISIQKVNSPEGSSCDQTKTNMEVCMSPASPSQDNFSILEDSHPKNEEGKTNFNLGEVSKTPEIDLPPRELAVLDKISKECDQLLSCISEPEPEQPDQTAARQNFSASDNELQKTKQPSEIFLNSSASKSEHLENIAIKSEPILLKQTLSRVNGIKGNPLVLNDSSSAAVKGRNILNDKADNCSLSQSVICRTNNSLIKKEPTKKIDDELQKPSLNEGKSETSSKLALLLKTAVKEESSLSFNKKMDDFLVKLPSGSSNHIAVNKLIRDSVNTSLELKSQENEIENQKLPTTPKFPANQKDNVIEQFKSKEELKTVYCHGGIVPLGKSSTSLLEKNSLDKRHILSLKEKKIKEIPDNSDPTTKLKEKNSSNVIESKPGSPLNGLRDNSDITAKVKEKSIHIGSLIESKPGSPFNGFKSIIDASDKVKEKIIQNQLSDIESEDTLLNELGDSRDATAELKETLSIQSSVIESKSLECSLNEVRDEEEIQDNLQVVDKPNNIACNNATPAIKTEVTEAMKEKIINPGPPVNVDLDLSKENDNEPANIVNSTKDILDSVVSLIDSPDENICSLEVVVEDTVLEEDPEKDDVILVETPLEVIELDSQDEDAEAPVPPIRMKVERAEDTPITICSEGDDNSDILAKHKENDSNQINTAEEPLPKRPRLEVNMTKMELINSCKICNTSFNSHAEWLQHYDNEVPKCTPNLKVSWESTEQALF